MTAISAQRFHSSSAVALGLLRGETGTIHLCHGTISLIEVRISAPPEKTYPC